MMGIKRTVVISASCDVCGNECQPDDSDVQIRVNNGDGRDVGPAYIHGRLEFDQPYGVSGGIVCKTCQIKWLKQYIKTLEAEITKDSVYDNEQEGDWE